MFSIIRRFTLPCICCTTTLLGIQLLSPSTKESCPKNRGSVPHHVDMTLPFLVDSLYYVLQWSFRISWDEIQLHLGMSWNNLLSIQDLIGDCGMCGGWARGDSLYSIEFNQFLGSRWEGDVATFFVCAMDFQPCLYSFTVALQDFSNFWKEPNLLKHACGIWTWFSSSTSSCWCWHFEPNFSDNILQS